MAIDIDAVKKMYEFEIEDHPTNNRIQFLNFKNGHRYKIQHPSMMEVHILIHDSVNTETEIFQRGLKALFSENDTSPKIDEEYFEAHPEDMQRWSLIVRGVLSQRWQKVQSPDIPEKLPADN